MAQSHLSASPAGKAGAVAHWEPADAQRQQPSDAWTRTPAAPPARPPVAVAVTPDDSNLVQVLAAWRAAERRLDEHIEASPMRALLQAQVERLRVQYQRLFTLKR
jgi:hypothetical protein